MSIFTRFSSNNNDKETKEKNKKKVSFSFDSNDNDNDIIATTPTTETTEENFAAHGDEDDTKSILLWYTKDEENEFRRRDQRMINLLFSGTYTLTEIEINMKGESSRGLEYACHDGYNSAVQKMNRIRNSVMAVLSTQRIFHKKGYKNCAEAIAIAYDMACNGGEQKASISSAIERAKSDEQFVEDHVRRQILKGDSMFNNKRQRREERPLLMGRQTANRSLSVQT